MGLLKSILALKHKQLPPLMHFSKPNRSIDFIHSPVYVNNRLTNWEAGDSPRRCGVSAFGMSGTNCHLVLEEAPLQLSEVDPSTNDNQYESILTLSAKNEASLKQLVELYVSMNWNQIRLDDVCFVANTGRDHHSYRLAIVFKGVSELISKLGILLTNGLQANEALGMYYSFHKSASTEAHSVNIEYMDHKEIASLYVQGAHIEWSRLYSNRSYRRVHLPTYPFAKTRCWLDIEHLTPHNTAIDKSKPTPSYEIKLVGRENGEYTANERLVAHLWGTTLGFNQLNIDDNFFELGGDSILGLKIVNSLSTQTATHIKVSDLFNYATIELLSQFMDTASAEDHGEYALWDTLVPIEEREHYPLTSSQFRVFVQEQLAAQGTDHNTPFCIMVEGAIDQARFSHAFQSLVDRHESLRTSFHYKDGEAVQQVAPQVNFEVEYSQTTMDRLNSHIQKFIRPFDLERPPLIRVGLVTLHPTKHLIIIDLHHIISDGVSSSILIKEFCEFYKGHTLPELHIQYKDYSVWQMSMLTNGTLARSIVWRCPLASSSN
jgi:acyl transferase domain-containing protein